MGLIYDNLKGSVILGIQYIYDYWQVIFDNAGLNIFNPVIWYKPHDNKQELWKLCLKDIINHAIVDIIFENNFYMKLILDNDITIEVSLKDNDYAGPEAFCLHLDNGQMIVE